MIKILIITALALFWGLIASAETVTVKPLRVEGSDAMSYAELTHVLDWADRIWEEQLPFSVQFQGVEDYPYQCDDYLDLSEFRTDAVIFCYRQLLVEQRISKKRRPTLVVLPPLRDGDVKLFAGKAYIGALKKEAGANVALAWCSEWSSHTPARLRDWACTVIVVHELMHLLGGIHTGGVDIMNGQVGKYADAHYGELRLSDYTINQVSNYLNKTNRKLIRKARRQYQNCSDVDCARRLAVLRYRAKHFYRGK